jgi:hypothetical protein
VSRKELIAYKPYLKSPKTLKVLTGLYEEAGKLSVDLPAGLEQFEGIEEDNSSLRGESHGKTQLAQEDHENTVPLI